MDGGKGACAWQHIRKDGKDFTSDYWHISLNKQTKKWSLYNCEQVESFKTCNSL